MSLPPVPPDPFEMDDAAYLVGALSPQERSRYEQHLQTCDACTRSVTELAGLPGVLRRLPVEIVQAMDDDVLGADGDGAVRDGADGDGDGAPGKGGAGADVAAPSAVLARLLDRAAREDRRERRARAVRWASALTTAAAAVVVASLAWFGPPGDAPAPVAPPSAELVFEPLHGTDLSASASLRDVAWGTKIQLECAYPEGAPMTADGAEPRYSLVVHGTDGARQQVATWNAVAGRELTIDAATAVRGTDIERLEVLTDDGTVVLRAAA